MTTKQKKMGMWGIVAAVVIIIGVLAYTAGTAGVFTGQMTKDQKAFVEQTTGLSPAEISKIAEEGKKNARQLLEGQGAAAPVAPTELPVGVKAGSWAKTVQTMFGPIKVSYTESASAKGKIAVWVQVERRGEMDGALAVYVQNITSRPIDYTVLADIKAANGKILKTYNFNRTSNPIEIHDASVNYGPEMKTVEIRGEIH